MIDPRIPLIIGAWVASVAGAAWWSYGAGQDHEISKQASSAKIRQDALDASAQSVAEAIAKLQPIQQTIIQKATHEIRKNTVFAECRSGVDLVRYANAIASGSSAPDVPGDVPRPDAH